MSLSTGSLIPTGVPGPGDATAPTPPEERGLTRDGIRMMVVRGVPEGGARIDHRRFRDLPGELAAGDLVVVNTSATIAAEADAQLAGTGPVVVHVGGRSPGGPWVVELRSAPDAATPLLDARPGDTVTVGRTVLRLQAPYPRPDSSPTGVGNRLWTATESGDLAGELARAGRPIAYGYLERRYPLHAYSTVFGRDPGSSEMPSAGRPFTDRLITDLVARGVVLAPITLHTGLSSQEVGEGPQPEWFEVPAATADLVDRTRARGGRVVAVGTTVTRALESCADADGRARAARGWTTHVVTPDVGVRLVDGLITGWHDPQASHLLLVQAVAGAVATRQAYTAAVAEGYLWHEFGDAALLLPSLPSYPGGGRTP